MAKTKKPLKKKSLVKVKKAAKPVKKPAPKKKAAAKKPVAKKPVKKIGVKKTLAKKDILKPARKGPPGIPEQMLDAALKVLDERQAEEIFTVDLAGKSSIADYLIIASGRASRQISAIAHHLREAFEKLGAEKVRVEGLSDANWVLVDAGDVVIHLFRPEVRRYYNLESIWGEREEGEDQDIKQSALLIE